MEEIKYKTEHSNPSEQQKRLDSYRQAYEKLLEKEEPKKQENS